MLRKAGFIEGINYEKQEIINGGGKPDYTFKMPPDRVLYMDVKFPLDKYAEYINAESDALKAQARLANSVAVPKSSPEMSRPSITGSAGSWPPASDTNVGNRSIVPATASQLVPAGIRPGQQAIVGTRTPPSHVLPLLPRSGPAEVKSFTGPTHGPLSLVKITSVWSSSPCSRNVSSTRPTLASTSSTQSPNPPLPVRP